MNHPSSVVETTPDNWALHHLANVVQQIAQVHDLPSLMEIVRRAARELTNSDGATLVLKDGDKCHYADEDAIGPLWKGQRFPLTSCISGWAMLHAEPVVISDIYADDRIPHAAYRPTFVNSLCMVPIGRNSPIGAIGCYWKDNHLASPAEVELQQALADATAIGITNIELYRQLDDSRQLAETRAADAQRNAKLFRTIFEHAGTGIAMVSLEGYWLRVNQPLCDFLGYAQNELMQLTFQDLTYPPDLDSDLQLVQKTLAAEINSYTIEKRYVRHDGMLVWANLTVTLERKNDGQPDYFIAVIKDVSERKAAETALEEEREILRSLANISAEYFWELDEQFRFKSYSPSIGARSGLDYVDLIGKRRWELPYSGISEADWAVHKADLAAHRPFRKLTYALPTPTGELRWFAISGDPIFSKTGEFKGYRGVTQDITESKQVEQELRQHAMVFESSQEGIVITDAQGCVLEANEAFQRITEYRLSEIHGRNMRFLQSGKQEPQFYRSMWQAIKETGSWQGEIWNRRKSGEVYLEWISISAIRDEHGKSVAYVGTHTDISRMNHVQSEMERLAHHDALTALPNRLLLMSRLEHALDRAKRGTPGAVLFLDLDGFKRVNDTHGHQTGDELLIAVAKRLSSRLREIDTLARLGGDEFVVVLEEIPDQDVAAIVAQQLIEQLKTPFDLPDAGAIQIGGSIGIALFPQDGNVTEQLLAQADQALYAAKSAGKGVYRFFADLSD